MKKQFATFAETVFIVLFLFGAIFVCWLLLGAASAHAADVERYVNTTCANDGDGTSADCAASPGGVGARDSLCDLASVQDLVTATTSWRINVAGATQDDCEVDLSGWTTSATYDLEISGDGTYALYSNLNTATEVIDSPKYLTLRNFTILSDTTTNNQDGLQVAIDSSVVVLDSMILQEIGTGGGGDGVQVTGSDVEFTIYNSLVKGWTRDGVRMRMHGADPKVIAYNNTFVDNASDGFTITDWNGTNTEVVALKNNLADGNGGYGYYSEGAGTNICGFITTCVTDNNWTDDAASSPDGASFENASFTFVNSANNDYTVTSASDGFAGGVNLTTDPDGYLSFSDELDGTTRVLPFDPGAFDSDTVAYAISGTITGDTVAGISITCSPDCGSTTTDSGGDYSITGIVGVTDYEITASIPSGPLQYALTPSSITGTFSGDVTGADFVTTLGDIGCGRDTNFDGSIDRWCPATNAGLDADNDGFLVADDCNDYDPNIYPGIKDVSGCSAGQYRYCKRDGSWSSCANISTYAGQDEYWPVRASYTHGTSNQKIRFQAWNPGPDGNDLTVTITNDPSISVDITGDDITITADTSSNTVNDVLDYILTDGSYRGVFRASSYDGDGSGLITALSQTNLSGGSNNRTFDTVKWIDLDAVSSGDGTYSSPYNDFDDISYQTLVYPATAGDLFVVKGTDNTINTTVTPGNNGEDAVLFFRELDGTETNPVRVTNWPGETWTIDYPRDCSVVTTKKGQGVYTYFSSNIFIDRGIIDHVCAANGYQASGIWYRLESGDTGFGIGGMTIKNTKGTSTENSSAIVINGDSTTDTAKPSDGDIRNNTIYNLDGLGTHHISAIIQYRPDHTRVNHNVIGVKDSANEGLGWGIKVKHTEKDPQSQNEVDHNIVVGLTKVSGYSIFGLGGADANKWWHHNLVQMTPPPGYEYLANCMESINQGGGAWQINELIEFNTCIGGKFDYEPNDLTEDTPTFDMSNLGFYDNTILDRNPTGLGAQEALIAVAPYMADSYYDVFVAEAHFDRNCYYNDQGQSELYSIFASGSNKGADYTSFTAWQAADTSGVQNKPAWDQNSFEEDPQLDAYARATSTNCRNKGWLGYLAVRKFGVIGGGFNAGFNQ